MYNRRSIRLEHYDYTAPGKYFITICTFEKRELFGYIIDRHVKINDFGRIVHDCWVNIPNHFDGCRLDEFIVMPNHIHGIIEICRRGTACHAPTMEQFGKPVSGSIPTIVRSFKSAVTKRINEYQKISNQHIWQRNFHDHIIRNNADLNRIRKYIRNNPLKWGIDKNNAKRRPSMARAAVLLALLLSLSAATGVSATESKTRYDELSRIIMKHTHLYYTGTPGISEEEYDALMRELVEIEKLHPEWVTPSSPTQKVGGALLDKGSAVKHNIPMLSIEKTYNFNGLMQYVKSVETEINTPVSFYVEHKFDGVAISLQYEKGILLRALTRGDGIRGDDVTNIVKKIPSIPQSLRGNYPSFLEVRGEIYIPKTQFEEINKARQHDGEKPFTNARNLAAGSLYLKDVHEAQRRGLTMTAFGIGQTSGPIALTQQQLLEKLNEFGFSVHSGTLCHSINDIIEAVNHIDRNKNNLAYEIDGVVIKVNNLKDQIDLGATSKYIRGMIAFKFNNNSAWTTLKDIAWQVGRTGKITPIAILEPVWLDGSLIERASLQNFRELQRLGLRAGDDVLIEKAGRIIPKIIKRQNGSKDRQGPGPTAALEKCPACLFPLAQTKRKAEFRCVNSQCPTRIKRQVEYFAQKNNMDIPGLGPAAISQMVDNGCVKNPADLYKLNVDSLTTCAQIKKARAHMLVQAIMQSKRRPLKRFICALGIPRLGSHKAGRLAGHFQSIGALQSASVVQLREVPGIGPDTAKAVFDYFHDEKTKDMLGILKKEGVFVQ